jgi:hypothetical protein
VAVGLPCHAPPLTAGGLPTADRTMSYGSSRPPPNLMRRVSPLVRVTVAPAADQAASSASFVTVFQFRAVPGTPSRESHFQEANGVFAMPSGSHR